MSFEKGIDYGDDGRGSESARIEAPPARRESREVQEARANLAAASDILETELRIERAAEVVYVQLANHFASYGTNNKHLELPGSVELQVFWRARHLYYERHSDKNGMCSFQPVLDMGWPRPAVLFHKVF